MALNWWRSPLTQARRAARSRQWAAATAAYHRHLARHPGDAAAWMQLGHGLKEQGDLPAAIAAYREAIRIAPEVADSWIHLAFLERGDREAAIAALLRAIAIDGNSSEAIAALVYMGARERLPLAIQRRIEAETGVYAVSRYAAWREAQAAGPLPADPLPADMLAVIYAGDAGAERIAATRATLGDMACLILTGDPAADGVIPAADHILLVEAGTRLAPGGVAALRAAIAVTGAGAAYGDHDHWHEAGGRIVHDDPCFQPMFDPLWFARAEVRPPCLLVTAAVAAPYVTWPALLAARLVLPVAYAHVPRIIAARAGGTRTAGIAPRLAGRGVGAIQVIVQTRDAPEMLAACIETLRATAARPDLLDIVIMDNRSVLAATATLLDSWAREGMARVIPHDAPFNWARANNLAVALGDAPYLLFLNNDVETQTAGWDDMLRAGLAAGASTDAGVGALGALLLYPDGLIQHAGVVLGMGQGGPLHEGVGNPAEPGGPAARWRHPRLAAAVTGAWLGTTRALFDRVGGFEERLPVGYNDVDFCLRVRSAGRTVAQDSRIVAIHRESATRGVAMSAAAREADEGHWAWMRARWGATLDLDPAYNPHWLREGRPFDGLHTPTAASVARWIAASAAPRPWAIDAPPA